MVGTQFENLIPMYQQWKSLLLVIGRIYYRLVVPLYYSVTELTSPFQCAIPVFEGLLPSSSHDVIVQKLLFELATWHGLAKLRQHTETNICDLENSTVQLGNMLRSFQQDVCSQYQTFNLPSEEAAWARKKAATANKDGAAVKMGKGGKESAAAGSWKLQQFNLNTYKTHMLGGYAKAIRLFGSPDNYNSQSVSNFTVKSCYFFTVIGGTRASTRKTSLQGCMKGKAHSRYWSTSSAETLDTSAAGTQ